MRGYTLLVTNCANGVGFIVVIWFSLLRILHLFWRCSCSFGPSFLRNSSVAWAVTSCSSGVNNVFVTVSHLRRIELMPIYLLSMKQAILNTCIWSVTEFQLTTAFIQNISLTQLDHRDFHKNCDRYFDSITSLTHWGRDGMNISQTTFSNVFSSMKMFEFRKEFHWSLFPRVQFTIFQHWFRLWLGAGQATSHYLNQWW